MTVPMSPGFIDQATVAPVVRQLLRSDTATVSDWMVHPLDYAVINPVTGALYRMSGTAIDGGRTRPWSVMLKGVRDLTDSGHRPFTDPRSVSYWEREVLAYRSGLLDELPDGLVAPRCLGLWEMPGAVWLWLEEFIGGYAGRWSIERYGLAARHLGSFNGAYLAGRPLPSVPWIHGGVLLIQDADLRQELETLRDAPAWQHPVVRSAVPQQALNRLRRFSADARVLLSALNRLPHTLCYNDAWRLNLFALGDGGERTGLIDWAVVGLGPVGEEIVQPIFGSLWGFETDIADAGRLEEAVLGGYLEGLQEAGWRGDASLVRFCYAASAMFHWGGDVARSILEAAKDESAADRFEETYGRSVEEYISQRGAMIGRLLDLVDEALGRL